MTDYMNEKTKCKCFFILFALLLLIMIDHTSLFGLLVRKQRFEISFEISLKIVFLARILTLLGYKSGRNIMCSWDVFIYSEQSRACPENLRTK